MEEVANVPQQQKNTEKSPENKSHKTRNIVIIMLIIICLLVLGPVLVAGYYGLVPGVASIMGANKAKDLGVSYTPADYDSFISKTQTNIQNYSAAPDNPEKPGKKIIFANPVTVTNQTTTQEEVTAAINESGWLWMPIDNAQVKFTDGTVEISGNLQLDYIANFITFIGGVGYGQAEIDQAISWGKTFVNNAPIYVKAEGSVTNNKLQLTVQEAKIGRFSIPTDIAQTVLSAGTQSAINNTPNLDIQSATITDGAIIFTGTHPSTIYVKTQ